MTKKADQKGADKSSFLCARQAAQQLPAIFGWAFYRKLCRKHRVDLL